MTAWAAVQADTSRGWGGPVAILVAITVMWVAHLVMERWGNPSPPPPVGRGVTEDQQVTDGVNGVDTDADTPWWGRIVDVDGVRIRRVRQVLTTGSSRLADDEDGAESLEEWVCRCLDEAVPYSRIVEQGMALYGVSAATMKRRIREARG